MYNVTAEKPFFWGLLHNLSILNFARGVHFDNTFATLSLMVCKNYLNIGLPS